MSTSAVRLPVACVSDLHLEFYHDKPAEEEALILRVSKHAAASPLLLVAGDLGYPFEDHYARALSAWSSSYRQVVLISGNHEYYCAPGHQVRTVASISAQIRNVCARFPNVTVLDNSIVTFDLKEHLGMQVNDASVQKNVRIIGTTLWYHTTPRQYVYVRSSLNDYRWMHVDKQQLGTTEPLQPHHVNMWHSAARTFLHEAIDDARHDKVPAIVMTHHLPTEELVAPVYRGSPINFAFATPLDDLVSQAPVCAIVCGHSHAQQSTHIGARRVPAMLNAAGYPHEDQTEVALEPHNCIKEILLTCE